MKTINLIMCLIPIIEIVCIVYLIAKKKSYICNECGYTLNEKDKVCSKCGCPIETTKNKKSILITNPTFVLPMLSVSIILFILSLLFDSFFLPLILKVITIVLLLITIVSIKNNN